MGKHSNPISGPSQVEFPWRATVRATLTALIGILPLLPDLARVADIETVPAVVSFLTIAAAVQRIITLPSVDKWLTSIGLGAHPKEKNAD
ncbi:hypothetical protein [Corynebacterium diphtheriae]|uniref:hypothetical protein n=1 Tax=Corynebacterium diphtheriae TaxID=1717 RepID=UPI0005C724A0|nr:hypothetical protein [Corynebacterium diphtheriae]MBG9256674.1 hypothetical protein [Corynebacterium diphtheriae bv. mitis]MBG9291124.1 hypothetical protein [Corynebacterium diphtheriae bv. gravis]MBG9355900.1 hypothetical protein [Corynebacterium diphtheriae bv. mitis]MDZ5308284.1 hypothetical protein [Corynebacterium diphtheriae]OIR92172.1 hypothetical protein BHF89_10055 [Corynebacterium diphtheriae]